MVKTPDQGDHTMAVYRVLVDGLLDCIRAGLTMAQVVGSSQ